MSHAVKIYDTCIGCTQCVRACPTDVLEMVPWDGCRAGQIASAPRTEDCVGCKRCEAACPTDFLSVRVYLGAEARPPWRPDSRPLSRHPPTDHPQHGPGLLERCPGSRKNIRRNAPLCGEQCNDPPQPEEPTTFLCAMPSTALLWCLAHKHPSLSIYPLHIRVGEHGCAFRRSPSSHRHRLSHLQRKVRLEAPSDAQRSCRLTFSKAKTA